MLMVSTRNSASHPYKGRTDIWSFTTPRCIRGHSHESDRLNSQGDILMKNSNPMYRPLYEVDPDIAIALDNEARRQHEGLELIASENFVSEAVLEAMGSVF